jgi:hypothetical protein
MARMKRCSGGCRTRSLDYEKSTIRGLWGTADKALPERELSDERL